ncbi:MAG: helix-turn-helix transcriptional regulator [Bacteroidales bacterium]|nr:helix-turn-helix transcriptional regulator [Bacteroidales bacterium]
MAQNDKYNQKQLESLQMSLIDLPQAGWMEIFQDDVLILQNPHFKADWAPYKMKHILLVLCNGGSGIGSINLRKYRLQYNSLLIGLPGQILASQELSNDFKGTFMLLSERFLSRLSIGDTYLFYKQIEKNPFCQLDEKAAATFRSFTDLSYNLMQMPQMKANMDELLRQLTQLFFLMIGAIRHVPDEKNDSQQRKNEVMMQYLQLVKLHYRAHRDVGFYADKMNISAKYMTTLIKNASGKSAIQWIEDYVILDAKAQLYSTVNTVQQIAYELNFPSQSLFGRYFKRIVGMSPTDYRASVRQSLVTSQT